MDESGRSATLHDWLREHAPDCGDNSCLFGGRGKGGMRTNGGCRCFKDLSTAKRIYVERLFSALPSATLRNATLEELEQANALPPATRDTIIDEVLVVLERHAAAEPWLIAVRALKASPSVK